MDQRATTVILGCFPLTKTNDAMIPPEVKGLFDPAASTISYVVSDRGTMCPAIVDSVLDYDSKATRTSTQSADRVVAYVKERGLIIEWHLETHAHADHLSAAPYLKEKLGGRIAIGEGIRIVQKTFKKIFNTEAAFVTDGRQFDHLFRDGGTFHVGQLQAHVLHTPGHTPACITYLIGDVAFGDTLFMLTMGPRAAISLGAMPTCFIVPSGSCSHCHQIPSSICATTIDQGRGPLWQTTVAEERANNIHVQDGVSDEAFVTMRMARDKTLDMPMLILPSVQVNIRAGRFPPPEDNGVSYLKIPLNLL